MKKYLCGNAFLLSVGFKIQEHEGGNFSHPVPSPKTQKNIYDISYHFKKIDIGLRR
jgi:hypothetical protein